MTVLSARAEKALAVLKEGGYMRLVRVGYPRPQFKTVLFTKESRKVAGFGDKTRFELEDAGLLRLNGSVYEIRKEI